ncbi:MAG: PSD1 and planctomycete cytochrome C domain-containing protein [Pirellulales bacterium]
MQLRCALRIPAMICCLVLAWLYPACCRAEVDFNRHIRPILAENCFQCHGPDERERAAELRLDVEQEAKKGVIVAGAADKSEFVHRIDSNDPESIMPPPVTGKRLTEPQKKLLKEWIQSGAKYSAHWSFQPIAHSEDLLAALPATAQQAGAIDRFLSASLTASGLGYSPEISKAQYIRRATFDLTGLPPTWSEIEAFENDTADGSYERLINRLLDSPRYGERWGRHWLDIARYADTYGGAAIGFKTFPFAYTYRDYVIGAMNRDLPVDRFIVEQIAADQLDLPENDPALAALGFLTVGMQFRNYHDTLDDQIDVITRGLMGLTVTCARCHDHKFDPIPTTDYYSLYAAVSPSKSPNELPSIAHASNRDAEQSYQNQLRLLNIRLKDFVRDQADVMRHRLRMQVGLYMTEIAKGLPEQDLSTEFLSYRTDDIRPLIFNRWRSYLETTTTDEPVLGPWVTMRSWGSISNEEFAARTAALVAELKKEWGSDPKALEKFHALRADPPKWNPILLNAIEEGKPSSLVDAARIYGQVFADAQKLWLQALAAATAEAASGGSILPDDHPQHEVINSPVYRQLRKHLYDPATPFDVSDEEAMRLTNRTISDLINAKRGAIHELNLSAPGSPPRAMVLREDPHPKPTYVFLRGNPLARGAQVEPKFLSVIPSKTSPTFTDGRRRLDLAQAVVSESNPLTARVIVNWLWQNHFGAGLVRTPDDFGTRGRSPTHPQLLDYLADQLRRGGWSLKTLHREIMLSQAYRQAAVENSAAREIDPDNELLWRMPRRRLDFEAMRDAMLAVSGELDTTMGGRPIDLNSVPAVPRRSVYGFTNRDIIANLMSTFDSANPNACTAKRPETTVPQQTLFALNSEFIQDRAAKVADAVRSRPELSDDDRIRQLVKTILCRNATDAEVARAQQFIGAAGDKSNGSDSAKSPVDRWVQLAHVLLASNEFMFLD